MSSDISELDAGALPVTDEILASMKFVPIDYPWGECVRALPIIIDANSHLNFKLVRHLNEDFYSVEGATYIRIVDGKTYATDIKNYDSMVVGSIRHLGAIIKALTNIVKTTETNGNSCR